MTTYPYPAIGAVPIDPSCTNADAGVTDPKPDAGNDPTGLPKDEVKSTGAVVTDRLNQLRSLVPMPAPPHKKAWWARIDPHAADVLDAYMAEHDITKTAWLEAVAEYFETIATRLPAEGDDDVIIARARQITDERRRRPR